VYNDTTDTRNFELLSYIKIDKNGEYILMRHDEFKVKRKFFSGSVDESILNLIDSAFFKKIYKSQYLFNPDSLIMYCSSLTYAFDHSGADKKRYIIPYIPPLAPLQIKLLGTTLDSIISGANKLSMDTLDLTGYRDTLKKLSFPYLPPLPAPPPPMKKGDKLFNPKDYK
jgi:hypothetical protein